MYKLIAIDLDGTLLNSQKQISDENIQSLKYAIDKGVRIVICSGRIFAGARTFARQVSAREPLIACNGAIIRDLETEELLYSSSMRLEECLKVIDICHHEDIYFHVYVGDSMYSERLEFSTLFYWKKNQELPKKDRVDIKLVESVPAALKKCTTPISKVVVICGDRERLQKVRARVSDICMVEVMSSNSDNFEVVNCGVNKGNALKYLCDRLGIKKEETIAIGDNENDYSMLQFAGLGVAMGNAENEIKEIADFVTLNNDENGVSEVVRKFIL